MLACCRHELPKACGFDSRFGVGDKSTFYERQERNFCRHPPGGDFFNDVIKIFLRAIGHALQVIRTFGILCKIFVND